MALEVKHVMPARPRVLISVNMDLAYGRGVLSGAIAFSRVHPHWDLTIVPAWDTDFQAMGPEVDAVILQADTQATELLARQGTLAVSVDDGTASFPLPSVINDNAAVGELAAGHLLDRGFRHFAFHGEPGRYYSDQRLSGFARVLDQRGATLHVYPRPPAGSAADDHLGRWLDALPPSTGVFACHDSAAHALVTTAVRRGRRIPEELAVLGVDNDQFICEMGPVPLSSVVTASEKIGYEAAALIHLLLSGRGPRSDGPQCVRPLGIVTRRSSDVLAVDDPYVVAAMRYVRDHLSQRFGVDDVVATLPVSRRYLENQFRRTLGRSPGEEIRRQRMDRACELLRTTDLTIGDVARACGFHETALFSHAFRQSRGTTPTAYRHACRLSGPAQYAQDAR